MITYKIHPHLYNGRYSKGSIFSNDIELRYFPNKESNKIEKIISRRFADENVRIVDIRIEKFEEFDNDELIKYLEGLISSDEYIHNESDAQLPIPEWIKYYSVICGDKTYFVPRESEIGKNILEAVNMKNLFSTSNKDLVGQISI